MSVQTSFNDKMDRTRGVLERAQAQGLHEDTLIIAVSGGTDSIVAADVMCRYGAEYGFEPDVIMHVNTGASVPQSKLAARVIAEKWDVDFLEQGYRKQDQSLAARILENGWPGNYGGSPMTGGHGLEWANRKDKPMNAVYMMFDGQQTWISGARKLESKKRSGNVPDSGIERGKNSKPRRTWVAIISGWTDAEKKDYIIQHELPVSESYLVLGFSAECVACAYDNMGLLLDVNLIAPELAHAISTLALMLYQRVRRGEIELAPKRLCWGWQPDGGDTIPEKEESETQELVGCSAGSCATRNAPEWIRNLEPEQIIDRADVLDTWEGNVDSVVQRFA